MRQHNRAARAPVALTLLALFPTSSYAQFHDVTLNTVAEFDAFRSQQVGFVALVYAPWCGHSRALLPEAEKAASMTKGVPFVKIDGTEASAVATKLDVKGYPSLLFVRRGDGMPIEYDGVRQAKPIADWAAAKGLARVARVPTAADVSSFVSRSKPIALILFTADDSSAEVEALEAVAASAGTSLPCAISTADPSDPALAGSGKPLEALGPLSRPVLVAIPAASNGAWAGEGPSALLPSDVKGGVLSHASMLRFGRTSLLPSVSVYATGQVEEEIFAADVPLHLLYFHESAASLAASGRDLMDTLRASGRSLRGRAILATIDVSKHTEVAAYFDIAPNGALPPPQLLAFSLLNGTKYQHTGSLTESGIQTFAKAAIGGKVAPYIRSQPVPSSGLNGPLVELVGSNFESVVKDSDKDVLVQFYSPQCGHCRKLVPVYKQVCVCLRLLMPSVSPSLSLRVLHLSRHTHLSLPLPPTSVVLVCSAPPPLHCALFFATLSTLTHSHP